MKRWLVTPGVGALVLLGIFAAKVDVETDQAAEPVVELADDHQFIGVARCKTCHRKDAVGNQFGIWEESRHATAFETLGTAEAKEVAAAKGIDNPQTSGECLQCHVTAFGVDESLLGPKYAASDGVGCESCHGAGGDYYKKKTMAGIMRGEIDPASVGLVKPDETACVGCHNDKSPSYKPFDFEKFFKKIEHPLPDSIKAKY